MRIRKARPEDSATLTAVAIEAKRHWGYPNEWIEQWRTELTISPDLIEANPVFAGVLDREIVGFYALRICGKTAQLQHLWVLPKVMGQRIGRALFTHAAERAREQGCTEMKIESDPNAEGFYARMGAERCGVRRGDLDGQRRELPLMVYSLI